MKSIPELSAETKLLEAYMRKNGMVGQTIPYAALNAEIGRDVQKDARCFLTSAKRRLLKEGQVWETVHNKGVKLLSDDQIVEAMGFVPRKIRRIVRVAASKGSKVSTEKLSVLSKPQYYARMSQLGALDLFTSDSGYKKLETATEKTPCQLPTKKMLDLFER
jgi:hypothetical protein